MSGPPASLRDRVLGEVSTRPAATRKTQRLRPLFIVLALSLFAAACSLIIPHHADVPDPPTHYIMIVLAASSFIALITAYLTHGPTSSPLGRSRIFYRTLAIATPLGLMAATLCGNLCAPSTLAGQTADNVVHFACSTITIIAGSAMLAVLLLLERRSVATAPAIKGASIGAVAGAWATLIISIQCPYAHPLHVVPTHILPIVLLVVVGMVIGARVLPMRSEDSSRR